MATSIVTEGCYRGGLGVDAGGVVGGRRGGPASAEVVLEVDGGGLWDLLSNRTEGSAAGRRDSQGVGRGGRPGVGEEDSAQALTRVGHIAFLLKTAFKSQVGWNLQFAFSTSGATSLPLSSEINRRHEYPFFLKRYQQGLPCTPSKAKSNHTTPRTNATCTNIHNQ
ncbi:hypothetical protein NL676_005159 [Syzygium grande]|nr:hypothetical protein NL676_005159 [Syzygium grande]